MNKKLLAVAVVAVFAAWIGANHASALSLEEAMSQSQGAVASQKTTVAAASQIRQCVFVAIAGCGDVPDYVKCDGYQSMHFIDGNQQLISLTMDLWNSVDHKREIEGIADIDKIHGSLKEYFACHYSWWDNIYGGPNAGQEPDYCQKVDQDFSEAFAASKLFQDFKNGKTKAQMSNYSAELGAFEIPADVPLYRSCNKSSGVVKPGE